VSQKQLLSSKLAFIAVFVKKTGFGSSGDFFGVSKMLFFAISMDLLFSDFL